MRKLLCISKTIGHGDKYKSSGEASDITIGKIYETDGDEPNSLGNIEIINDLGEKDGVRVYCFEEVKEEMNTTVIDTNNVENDTGVKSNYTNDIYGVNELSIIEENLEQNGYCIICSGSTGERFDNVCQECKDTIKTMKRMIKAMKG